VTRAAVRLWATVGISSGVLGRSGGRWGRDGGAPAWAGVGGRSCAGRAVNIRSGSSRPPLDRPQYRSGGASSGVGATVPMSQGWRFWYRELGCAHVELMICPGCVGTSWGWPVQGCACGWMRAGCVSDASGERAARRVAVALLGQQGAPWCARHGGVYRCRRPTRPLPGAVGSSVPRPLIGVITSDYPGLVSAALARARRAPPLLVLSTGFGG